MVSIDYNQINMYEIKKKNNLFKSKHYFSPKYYSTERRLKSNVM